MLFSEYGRVSIAERSCNLERLTKHMRGYDLGSCLLKPSHAGLPLLIVHLAVALGLCSL